MPKLVEVVLNHNKTTAGTERYGTPEGEDRNGVHQLYIDKSVFKGKRPDSVTLVIS